nr:ARMT1-like domain-containing protein [uncultured Sphaerochaeta sp.]
MNTTLECIPCFFNQVLASGKLLGLSPESIKQIMDEVGNELKHFPLDMTPPAMAYHIQRLFVEKSGEEDPYRSVKKMSNTQALAVIDDLRTIVRESQNPLKTAVKLACAGNIIDYGAFPNGIDVQGEITRILEQSQEVAGEEATSLFDFDTFKQSLHSAERLMYIGDNAGEIVFDKVLLETIARAFPQIELYFVTRGQPILNDVLTKDALDCGIDSVATIVSSGSRTPGLILSEADPEFLRLYDDADLIISKGQGNFEALSQAEDPIFFLFIIKCEVISNHIGGAKMELVLKSNTKHPKKA